MRKRYAVLGLLRSFPNFFFLSSRLVSNTTTKAEVYKPVLVKGVCVVFLYGKKLNLTIVYSLFFLLLFFLAVVYCCYLSFSFFFFFGFSL
jgi:hypothetical protein